MQRLLHRCVMYMYVSCLFAAPITPTRENTIHVSIFLVLSREKVNHIFADHLFHEAISHKTSKQDGDRLHATFVYDSPATYMCTCIMYMYVYMNYTE